MTRKRGELGLRATGLCLLGLLASASPAGLLQLTFADPTPTERLPCPVNKTTIGVQVVGQTAGRGPVFDMNEKEVKCCNSVRSAKKTCGRFYTLEPGDTEKVTIDAEYQSVYNTCWGDPGGPRFIEPYLSGPPGANKCVRSQKSYEEIDSQACGPVLMNRARTLGDGTVAVDGTVSHAVFDQGQTGQSAASAPLDSGRTAADRIPIDERPRAWLTWTSLAYGLTPKLDVSVVVPYFRFRLPDVRDESGALRVAEGRYSGVGDAEARALLRVSPHKLPLRPEGGTVALSLLAAVRAPTGDDEKLLGTGHWEGRLGAVTEIALSHPRRLVPNLSAWVFQTDGYYGWGFSTGADYYIGDTMELMAALSGKYNDPVDSYDYDYLDGSVAFRFGPSSTKTIKSGDVTTTSVVERHVRLDGTVTLVFPLNDTGPRPNRMILASLQFTFGQRP